MITNCFRFRVGVSLVLGLFWTSAAVGGGPVFPCGQYAGGDWTGSVAIGDPRTVQPRGDNTFNEA